MLIQFSLLFFVIFALSRVILQLRQGNLTIGGFIFWIAVFFAAFIGILLPELTGKVANFLGIGRGADVIIYISIALLFYLVFRLTIALEDIRHEISELVRELALRNKRGRRE